MICPKCNKEVPNNDTCSSCGIVIDKYIQSQEKKAERELSIKIKASSENRNKSQLLKSLEKETPWPFRKVSDSKLAEILYQLSRMLASGISMRDSLLQIQRNTDRVMASSITTILKKIEMGSSFSAALEVAPNIYSHRMRLLVEVGEKTGELPHVLSGISEMLELRDRIRRRIVMSCLYPFFLLTLFFFSIPVIKLFTEGIIAYLIASIVPYLLTIALIIFVFYILPLIIERLLGQELYQKLLRRLPFIGKLYTYRSTLLFCRTLQITLNAGEELLTALGLAAQSTGDILVMKQINSKAILVIQDGASLEKALANAHVFDNELMFAVSTGELSGKLTEVLDHHAEKTHEKLVNKLEIFVWIISIVVLLTVSIIIAYGIVTEFKRILDLYETISTELNSNASTVDLKELLKGLGGL